ncbi:NAD(P)-dependent oxidoreductase [Actinomarinicola tropica]|uniref:NAD(P)-dependent oxidoreductase n=1 Tax=Actinomarinicola tropica TaxID=2789776 RepID=A0A5Q2RQ58_9ACTN|nr:NAD(P)-binding domain-containing protein [Actinomarinicola tropica]QGG96701.1 NAD(P)-dependent oxidoreductase [Actinomarinicola tropica]
MTATTDTSPRATDAVTVLGLGAMGSAIAAAFVERGYRTTVWNRTSSKTAPLVAAGATAAANPADAVAASPITVICLLDTAAVDAVLDSLVGAVAGKVIVDLTSGGPDHARAVARWAEDQGAEHLDGKIMSDPPDIGSGPVTLPVSGSRRAFEAHEQLLRELGTVTYHGEDAGAAAVEFMAQVAACYELLIGFLHTVALVRAEGADTVGFAERLAETVGQLAGLLPTMAHAVETGTYPPDLGPLDVQAALMPDLIAHRDAIGVESVRMREVRELMDRRIADGHGDEGFSGLFELLAVAATPER